MKNRAIPEKVIGLLLEYGRIVEQRKNIQFIHFHPKDRAEIVKNLTPAERRLFDKKQHAFIVLGGTYKLVTAGYKTRRTNPFH